MPLNVHLSHPFTNSLTSHVRCEPRSTWYVERGLDKSLTSKMTESLQNEVRQKLAQHPELYWLTLTADFRTKKWSWAVSPAQDLTNTSLREANAMKIKPRTRRRWTITDEDRARWDAEWAAAHSHAPAAPVGIYVVARQSDESKTLRPLAENEYIVVLTSTGEFDVFVGPYTDTMQIFGVDSDVTLTEFSLDGGVQLRGSGGEMAFR